MNIHMNRRAILKGLTASSCALPFIAQSQRSPGQESEALDQNFFLMVLLKGGADHSYLFDARPLEFTNANLIQNYTGEAPVLWEDSQGRSTFVSKSANKLATYQKDLLILNGVHMDPGFEGHLQNVNVLTPGYCLG